MRFQRHKDKKLQWRWRAVSNNGRILADSAESYSSNGNLERAIAAFIVGVCALQHLKGEPLSGVEDLEEAD